MCTCVNCYMTSDSLRFLDVAQPEIISIGRCTMRCTAANISTFCYQNLKLLPCRNLHEIARLMSALKEEVFVLANSQFKPGC